jgi:hypothetical protein
MTMTNTILSVLSEQVRDASTTWEDAKAKALAGTLTWDEIVKSSSKFWVGTCLRWWGLYPVGGTPIAYGSVPAGAANYAGSPIAVEPVPQGTTVKVALVPVHVAKSGATGTPAVALQSDGTLKIDVNALTNLSAGDAFLVVAYYDVIGGGQQTLAVLVLSVT